MTNLKWIALAAVLASSSAFADKIHAVEAADRHDRGCESIPAFYPKEREDCINGMVVQHERCTAPLTCPDPGKVRTDIATAESRLRTAEQRLTKAKSDRAKAKTPADQKKAHTEEKAATDAVAQAKQDRAKALATQATLKKDNATMATKIGKCVDARTAVLNSYQHALDRLRTEKPDQPADKARFDTHVRSLGGKYSVEQRGHTIQIKQLRDEQKGCEAHL